MRIPDGVLSTLIELVGLALLVGGCWALDTRAGVAALGVALFVLGLALGGRSRL